MAPHFKTFLQILSVCAFILDVPGLLFFLKKKKILQAAKQFVKGGLSLWYKNGKVATAVHRKPDGDARPAKAGSDENASDADDEVWLPF